MKTQPLPEHPTAQTLRRFALALCLLGVVTTPIELVLMHHYNDKDQIMPFVFLGLAAIGIVAAWFRPSAKVLRGVRVLMVLVVLGSGIGVMEHLKANYRDATRGGGAAPNLIEMVLTGFAPLLAPGILAQVGLLGLAFTYKHPAFDVPEVVQIKATQTA
jgi:predicted membrane channel-forming protein YqfA (hemolysin III family)